MTVLILGSSSAEPGTQKRAVFDAFIPWICRRVPQLATAGVTHLGEGVIFLVATGAEANSRPLAAVLFHNYQPAWKTIEVTMASDSRMWAKKPAISAMLHYVFNDLKCERLQAVTARKGRGPRLARRFLERLGFRYEGIGRLAFGRDDAVMFSMLREDAQYWLTGIKPRREAA